MGVRLLHTADWHLGKQLHGTDLSEDHLLFLNELISIIHSEQVNYLLVAGDVFDQANPSNDTLELYYTFLREIRKTNCSVIITGGNHDSPGVLNAPKQLLHQLQVEVIGCATEQLRDQILPLRDINGKITCVLAAVPYLRDRDVRRSSEGESYSDRIIALREGIRKHYKELEELCKELYPGIPAIASGHLYAQGAETSESEREIQIGNQASIDEGTFGNYFQYVALGHIHKPQNLGNSGKIRYSGSPFALSLSERSHDKRIILLEIEKESVSQKDIPLKKNRELVLIEGSAEEVERSVLKMNTITPLPPLAEIRIIGSAYDPSLLEKKEVIVDLAEQKGIQVLLARVNFPMQEQLQKEDRLNANNTSNLSPIDVLRSQFTEEDDELKKELEIAFLDLIERINEKGGEA